MDEKSEPFGFAISLFKEKYGKGLTEIFKSKYYRNFQNITCFCELICESSAFGQHDFINGKFDRVKLSKNILDVLKSNNYQILLKNK